MLIPWGNTKLLGQKKSKFIVRSKFIVGSNFSCNTVFSLYRNFIETTATRIDMLLQVWLQVCNNHGFVAISDARRNSVVCPLLDSWMLCRIGVLRQEMCLTVLGLVNAQSILHKVFQLYELLRFATTLVVNVLICISTPNLNMLLG